VVHRCLADVSTDRAAELWTVSPPAAHLI